MNSIHVGSSPGTEYPLNARLNPHASLKIIGLPQDQETLNGKGERDCEWGQELSNKDNYPDLLSEGQLLGRVRNPYVD